MHKTRAAVLILFLASTLAFGGCLVRQQTGKDGKGPEITMDNSEISASIHAEEPELLAGVTAYDKKDGDVTSSLAVDIFRILWKKGGGKSVSSPLIPITTLRMRSGNWCITITPHRSFPWIVHCGSA